MLSGRLSFKCTASLSVFVGEEINVGTVCVCVPVLVQAVVDQSDQCKSWHFFSRAELSLSAALLQDFRAPLFLDMTV